MSDKLVFMNSCDSKYSNFIVPYVYFSSLFNKNAIYEFLVVGDIDEKIEENIIKLKNLLDLNIIIRRFDNSIFPSKLRFLEEPASIDYDYSYIGDIDIIILEDIIPFHKQKMINDNSIFDNIVRPNDTKKLSGLQFCSKKYFKLSRNARIMNRNNSIKYNEVLLLKICQDSHFPVKYSTSVKQFSEERPIHGIHVSLNRKPFSPNSSMGFSYTENDKNKFTEIISTDFFKNNIYCLFSSFYKEIFLKICDLMKIKFLA